MTQPAGARAIPAIDVSETASRLESGGSDGPILVDVREDDELRAARVAGAIHVPMSSFADRYTELPRNRPLLVMCATGGRSSAATAFLLRNGWTDVANVEGGITAWQRAGMPVRKGPIEPGEGTL
jgi:rhodanese-related sulfurtransferase